MKKTKKYLTNSIRQPYQKNVLKIIFKTQHVIYEKRNHPDSLYIARIHPMLKRNKNAI